MRKLIVSLAFALGAVAPIAHGFPLWGIDPATPGGELVNIESDTGAVIQRFALPAGTISSTDTATGLAGWGNELFYINGDSDPGEVYVIDPADGSLIRQYGISGGFGVTGLGYWTGAPGAYLYTCGCAVGDMHRYQAADGAAPEFFWSTVVDSDAVAGDNGGRIFSFAKASNLSPTYEIFEIDPVVNQPPLNSFPAPSQNVVGMAYDGRYLYASDSSGTLYTLDAEDGTLVNSVAVGFTLWGLASSEGSPAPPPPPGAMAVPTLSQWGIATLSLLLLLYGIYGVRRRTA